MSYFSRFRNSDAAQRYVSAYDATLALWPAGHEALSVETRFGATHINSAGSPALQPLMLIHGAQTSSTVWYPNIAALSRHFRVYAPDVIDQSGKSVPTQRLRKRQDYADWLCDVLDALRLERAAFAGHSHGGWQVLNLAITAPQRIDRMVLLSPAGITRLRLEIFLRMLPAFIVPTKKMFYRSFQWSTVHRLDVQQPAPVIDQIRIGATTFKANELSFGVADLFDDDALRQIQNPTLLLVGDREKIFNPGRLMERAQRLMPNLEAQLVKNTAHLLPIDQAETVNRLMLEFLTK